METLRIQLSRRELQQVKHILTIMQNPESRSYEEDESSGEDVPSYGDAALPIIRDGALNVPWGRERYSMLRDLLFRLRKQGASEAVRTIERDTRFHPEY